MRVYQSHTSHHFAKMTGAAKTWTMGQFTDPPDKTARIVYAVNEADGRRPEISCMMHAGKLTATKITVELCITWKFQKKKTKKKPWPSPKYTKAHYMTFWQNIHPSVEIRVFGFADSAVLWVNTKCFYLVLFYFIFIFTIKLATTRRFHPWKSHFWALSINHLVQ